MYFVQRSGPQGKVGLSALVRLGPRSHFIPANIAMKFNGLEISDRPLTASASGMI